MPRALPFAFASTLLLAIAAPAMADPTYEVRSEVVSFADLNLAYPADADILLDRIHHAARHVCSDGPGISPVVARSDARECATDAERQAVADTNSSVVIARYYGYEPQVVISENDVPTSITVYKKKG